jgi:hypothetical protein
VEGLITGRLPNALSEVDYKLEVYRRAKMCPSTGVTPNSMVLMEMLLQILRMMLFSVKSFSVLFDDTGCFKKCNHGTEIF